MKNVSQVNSGQGPFVLQLTMAAPGEVFQDARQTHF